MKPMKGVEVDEMESWKSAISGIVYVKKYNEKGMLEEFPVYGGRNFVVTPHERRINQEEMAESSLDPFTNGMFVPVRLIESEPETAELKANSNAMSETAMKALFRSQKPTFTKKVQEINNMITLRRLLEVAEDVDASMAQYKIIQERIAEIGPQISETTLSAGPELGSKLRAVAPR